MRLLQSIKNWNNTHLSEPIYKGLEDTSLQARFPYRYFIFLSATERSQDLIRSRAINSDRRDKEQWEIEVRRYYVKVAVKAKSELLHISVGDTATHIHSVVCSAHKIDARIFHRNWTYCDGRIRGGKRMKEIREYDATQNGIAYMYDHHVPFKVEHIVSRRIWRGWKQDAVVDTINTLLRGNPRSLDR